MQAPTDSMRVKGIVAFGSLSLILFEIHGADDIVSGEAANLGGTPFFAVFGMLISTLFVFGLGWSWKQKKQGYAVVLVLSAFSLFGSFLSHAVPVAPSRSLAEMEAFFVVVSKFGGVSSLTALVLSIYALVSPKKP